VKIISDYDQCNPGILGVNKSNATNFMGQQLAEYYLDVSSNTKIRKENIFQSKNLR
jgi:hypothetical protein